MLSVMMEVIFGLIGTLGIFFLCVGVPYLSVKKYFEEREFYLDKSNRKIILKESYRDKSLRKKHLKKVKLHLKDLSKEKKRMTFIVDIYEQTVIGKNIVYLKKMLFALNRGSNEEEMRGGEIKGRIIYRKEQ